MSDRYMSLSGAVNAVNRQHGLDIGYQRARDMAIRNMFPALLVGGRWQVDHGDLPKLAAAFGAELDRAA